ncbi:MAG: glycosyltransferase family A protein [Thermoplasmata archaeon]
MTVRNNAGTLRDSLETVLPQVAGEGELVIVDSLSNDGTQAILAEVARTHPEVTVIERSCHRGDGRNLAVALAHTSIVVTQVDGDNRYAPGVLRALALHVRDHPSCDAAFGIGNGDFDPSSTHVYAWRKEAFERVGGYEPRQEREEPPLWLRAFRGGLRFERVLLPRLADDLKPRRAGSSPTVSPWRRGTHMMWGARIFRVIGFRYPEYVRLLRLTRRTTARFLAGITIGGVAYLQGAWHGDGPDILLRDIPPTAPGLAPESSPPQGPGPP